MLALIVCLIGLVLYLLTLPPKATEAGRVMFFAGLLALLLTYTPLDYLVR